MFIVTKVFKVTDFTLTNNNLEEFLLDFYTKLQSGGHITNILTSDQFLEFIQIIKVSYLESGKIVNKVSRIVDNTLVWVATFDTESSYQEYKQSLIDVFDTDFHMNIEDSYISLSTSEETT